MDKLCGCFESVWWGRMWGRAVQWSWNIKKVVEYLCGLIRPLLCSFPPYELTHGWFMVQNPHNNMKLRLLNLSIALRSSLLLAFCWVIFWYFFVGVYMCAYIFFTKMKLNPPSPGPFWKSLKITCISIFCTMIWEISFLYLEIYELGPLSIVAV